MISIAFLATLQVLGTLAFITSNASAQGNEDVIVLVGEKGRHVCEVQHRKSDDGNWGAQSLEGPPQACEGGIVTASRSTQEAARQLERDARSSQVDDYEVRIVELTGDGDEDDAAILAETDAIHQLFYPEGEINGAYGSENLDNTLGFMAAGARDHTLTGSISSAVALATDCKEGRVPRQRRVDFKIKMSAISSSVFGSVFLKRLSCKLWKITKIEMLPQRPFTSDHLWFRNFFYNKAWYSVSRTFDRRSAGKQCLEMYYDEWLTWPAGWDIRTQSTAKVELIDSHPLFPEVDVSCYGGAGTSRVVGVTGWFVLPGGIK